MIKKKKLLIPNDVMLLYCRKKNIVTFVGSCSTKSIQPFFKIFMDFKTNTITVTNVPVNPKSQNKIKKTMEFVSLQISLFKNTILETKHSFHVKMTLVGVGYRILLEKANVKSNNFKIKLGYSHLTYYNLPRKIDIFCYKYGKFTLHGKTSFNDITQTASKIRDLRSPEPYKGKGVLYANEKIKLKTGKRV